MSLLSSNDKSGFHKLRTFRRNEAKSENHTQDLNLLLNLCEQRLRKQHQCFNLCMQAMKMSRSAAEAEYLPILKGLVTWSKKRSKNMESILRNIHHNRKY